MCLGSSTGYQWELGWVELTLKYLMYIFFNTLKGSLIKQNAAGFHFGIKIKSNSLCGWYNFNVKISWNKSM